MRGRWKDIAGFLALAAALSWCGWVQSRPETHMRHDFWLERQRERYVTCRHDGGYSPTGRMLLFTLPGMLGQKLDGTFGFEAKPCSGVGVSFPSGKNNPRMRPAENDAIRHDVAALLESVILPFVLVRFWFVVFRDRRRRAGFMNSRYFRSIYKFR
jgi:hypothetical protein